MHEYEAMVRACYDVSRECLVCPLVTAHHRFCTRCQQRLCRAVALSRRMSRHMRRRRRLRRAARVLVMPAAVGQGSYLAAHWR
jgi:hypothetical protein